MSDKKSYLVRTTVGDQAYETEQEMLNSYAGGKCRPSDFVFDFQVNQWFRMGDHPSANKYLGPKPTSFPEKKLVYLVVPGSAPKIAGPFSGKEVQQKAAAREISENCWVFVEGDKEWRQIKAVKLLFEMLPKLPTEVPQPVAEASPEIDLGSAADAPPPFSPEKTTGSIGIELDDAPPALNSGAGDEIEREDATLAFSPLGLSSLKVDHSKADASAPTKAPPKGPPANPAAAKPSAPPKAPPSAPQSAPPKAPPLITPMLAGVTPGRDPDQGSFDGLTAEIPTDPIWLVKQANSEAVSGPFRFLEIIKFLEEGKLNKGDKISKTGTNRYVKIQQQYEFNVKFSVETVIEHGVEKQKIYIKRRHPRVPYFTGVQVFTKEGILAGDCVNISAGGILMENTKADFNLGDIIEIKLLPGLIKRQISVKSLVIGKIPKIPTAFALKFEDLKTEDKEAIEVYVQEMLKREMLKNS
jgi:hypothetical protein